MFNDGVLAMPEVSGSWELVAGATVTFETTERASGDPKLCFLVPGTPPMAWPTCVTGTASNNQLAFTLPSPLPVTGVGLAKLEVGSMPGSGGCSPQGHCTYNVSKFVIHPAVAR